MTSVNSSELSRILDITNKRGLHARASHRFVQVVEKFDATVSVSKDNMKVGGDEIMELLMLAASPGCSILVEASGPEAVNVLDALEELVTSKFGESE
ncbi:MULTISPECIES: HPr family phosphocarrier protein [unclassified Lentilitoribacter]|jgi:phosphocarrier protein|uniref:HPr family phosphocarrier protein n=1 Tax=unclassified Lentilitoribacter TaxID=2647570 RepID=UPI0013A6C23E|nr:HPr family phosphocarrier protein [Lentilitoribacter sp. Alg239-R112]